jgi:guanosine-3',5'-bis(diphosphate) 3'-pyrophosphohydrolase
MAKVTPLISSQNSVHSGDSVPFTPSPLANTSIEDDGESTVVIPQERSREDAARSQVRTLIERTRLARPNSDADLLQRAYAFASEKHTGQKRMSGEPFIEHPIAVAGILAELGMDDTTIAVGLLHDVTEDCGVSHEEMTQRFGADVAYLVDGVTKLKRLDFSNKQEKQAENLRKLFLAMSNDVRVIIVKLCDRLHNVRTLDPFPDEKRREIAAETLYIFAPIAHRLGIWRLKWELEDRSFKFLEPEAYRQIHAWVQRTRAERNDIVQGAITTLQEGLAKRGIEAEVTGRPKHFYSIYQKMLKQGLRFEDIKDLSAIRVICKQNEDCYTALGVVNALWLTVPGMFFDYIAQPKPNNYRSIHTKILDGHGEILEVQIRSREMHREAEYGIAAHWRYKGDGKRENGKIFGDKLNWLRMVLELQDDTVGDAKGFLDSLRLDLGSDQIFAFTPKGDVVYLPQDSTPVDFAFRIHSEIGHHCTGAKVNGRIAPLNYKLHNGDICEITTSRSSHGPKRGWLDFAVTPHARNRIKNFLRKQNFEENYKEGMARLEKAAQLERLKLGSVADNESLARYATHLKLRSVEELIAGIGYGEYSAENVLNRIRTELQKPTAGKSDDNRKSGLKGLVGIDNDTLGAPASSLLSRRSRHRGERFKDEDGETQRGHLRFRRGLDSPPQDDLLYSIARCCAPIAGDEVKGYITRGRGITVHRADCSNLRHYEEKEPQRLLDAEWTSGNQQSYQVLVAVESDDRVGLLHELTSVIATRKINIIGVNTYPLKNKRARLNFAVTINNVDELGGVIEALQSVAGVTKVHRV